MLLALVLPYCALIYASFTRYTTGSFEDATFTTSNVIKVMSTREVVDASWNTLLVGVASPTCCLVLSLILVYAIRRLRIGGRGFPIDYLTIYPIAVPGMVFGARDLLESLRNDAGLRVPSRF